MLWPKLRRLMFSCYRFVELRWNGCISDTVLHLRIDSCRCVWICKRTLWALRLAGCACVLASVKGFVVNEGGWKTEQGLSSVAACVNSQLQKSRARIVEVWRCALDTLWFHLTEHCYSDLSVFLSHSNLWWRTFEPSFLWSEILEYLKLCIVDCSPGNFPW